MKKNFILFLALVSVFYSANNAQAGFLIEPFAGMEMNSTSDGDGEDADITGSTVGARIGFQNVGLMLGLDARKMSWNLDSDSGDVDYSFTQMGFFVGYDFPIMLRVWGNYVFSLEGENDDNDTKVKEGSGMVLGVGYKIFPFISLNLEVGNTSTTKFESGSNELDHDQNYNSYLLSVSFPISI